MLLETETRSLKLSTLIAPPPAALSGQVSIEIDLEPLNLSLRGSGTGWHTDGMTLHLKPATSQNLPVWYQFEVSTEQLSGLSLVGLQIFIPGDNNSTIYFPAVNGTATVNLINNLAEGDSVLYTLAVGIDINGEIHWIDDPTIAFDPQGT